MLIALALIIASCNRNSQDRSSGPVARAAANGPSTLVDAGTALDASAVTSLEDAGANDAHWNDADASFEEDAY